MSLKEAAHDKLDSETEGDISLPTNVKQGLHVFKDARGNIVGLPDSWIKQLTAEKEKLRRETEQIDKILSNAARHQSNRKTMPAKSILKPPGGISSLPMTWTKRMNQEFTEEEQHDTPDAIYGAMKFYKYCKHKDDMFVPFKSYITEQTVLQENTEINQLKRDTVKRQDASVQIREKSGSVIQKTYRHSLPIKPKRNSAMFHPQVNKTPVIKELRFQQQSNQ